jgi:hypothetical protein
VYKITEWSTVKRRLALMKLSTQMAVIEIRTRQGHRVAIAIDCFVRLIEAGKKLVNHQGFVGSGETHCSVNDFLGFCPHVSDHNKQLNIGLCKRLSPA